MIIHNLQYIYYFIIYICIFLNICYHRIIQKVSYRMYNTRHERNVIENKETFVFL